MLKLHTRYLNVGTNLEFNDSLTDTILTAIELGVYTASFNLGNSRNCTRKRIEMEDLVMSMGLSTRFPTILFSIIPSMYNLCGSRNFLAWNGNSAQDGKTAQIIKEIEYELYALAKLGGSSIIEIGSYRTKKSGLETAARSINNMKYKLGYSLVLINSLDRYFNVGITLNDLKTVYDNVDKHSKQYIHIGFNIAYFFLNGLYDLRNVDEVDRLFDEYDKMFSNKYLLTVILLSDCQHMFGAREYIYEPIGSGEIWKDSNDALYALISQCQKRNISILTNHQCDMELVRAMGEQLFA